MRVALMASDYIMSVEGCKLEGLLPFSGVKFKDGSRIDFDMKFCNRINVNDEPDDGGFYHDLDNALFKYKPEWLEQTMDGKVARESE